MVRGAVDFSARRLAKRAMVVFARAASRSTAGPTRERFRAKAPFILADASSIEARSSTGLGDAIVGSASAGTPRAASIWACASA